MTYIKDLPHMKKTFNGSIKKFNSSIKKFSGESHSEIPEGWNELTMANPWLNSIVLNASKYSDKVFTLITHPGYCCCEYRQSLNIFTFGRLKMHIPFVVIGLPVSVDECGFTGNLNTLIEDYKRRKGLFLVLNMHGNVNKENIAGDVSFGKTLSTAIFDNHFKTYDEYLAALRSPYRRRIRTASLKSTGLIWKEIDQAVFDEKLHTLYLNVLNKSKYPLEKLSLDFFRTIDGQIHVLYENQKPISEELDQKFNSTDQELEPLAFILVKWKKETLHFLFGGMNYDKRDEHDLYYNMLLKILKIGISGNASKIDFGQTAESSKCRIGCRLEDRNMIFFSGNKIINRIAGLFFRFLEYKQPHENYNIYR